MQDNSILSVCLFLGPTFWIKKKSFNNFFVFYFYLFFLKAFNKQFVCLCCFSCSHKAEIWSAAMGGLCLQRGSQRSEEQTIIARGSWHKSLSRWLKWAGVAAGSRAQFRKSCQSSSAYGCVIDHCCVWMGHTLE